MPLCRVPDLSPGQCHVWWANPAAAEPALARLLDDTELERMATFEREQDARRFLVAHALARVLLAAHLGVSARELAFSTVCIRCGGPHGKPRLCHPTDPIELSLSHAGGRVVLAVARGVAVGVDVEPLTPPRDTAFLAHAVLSAAEQRVHALLPTGQQDGALLRYWTRKEALLKATGDGLAVDPTTLTVSRPSDPPRLLSWVARPPECARVYLYDLHPGPAHIGCLASLDAPLEVSEFDAGSLLEKLPRV